jgi:hypothetical protein
VFLRLANPRRESYTWSKITVRIVRFFVHPFIGGFIDAMMRRRPNLFRNMNTSHQLSIGSAPRKENTKERCDHQLFFWSATS